MRHGFVKVAAATPDIRVADVEYNTWMYGRWLNLDENNEKKYYVFQAKKDGQTWQIAADPKGGQLVQITAAED